jgi:hypothetical protein
MQALALAVSELASNEVLHAGYAFVVTLERLDDGVRVSVSDSSCAVPRLRDFDAMSVTGRVWRSFGRSLANSRSTVRTSATRCLSSSGG